ncbi:MAG: flagellar biosynthesis anti-sigma factor FlgM [Chromatiales bacterium]|nr:flagellar biosynthesis anti-sigma factor FlgM [Chromatiales bacterium]
MAIEINGLPSSSVHQAGDSGKGGEPLEVPAPRTQSTSAGSSDTVSLTQRASQLDQLERSVSSQPVVDTQRVEAIRKAISDGSFEVDPARTADKLIQFESSLDR